MNNDSRKCLVCGKSIKGRADKKYCDNFCRNAFNNRKNHEEKYSIRFVNKKLKRNRRILSDFLKEGEEWIYTNKIELLEHGFNFTYVTGHYRTEKGDIYYFCYDVGYHLISDQQILIVKKLPGGEV